MSPGPGVAGEPEAAMARRGRVALWICLIVGWGVMVVYMWDAVTTLPDADRLAESRLVAIPGARTFITSVIFSGLELAVVLAALWPGWSGWWASRLSITALGLVTWFIMTTPMRELSRLDWVHRRWLAFMFLVLVAALATTVVYRLVARWASTGGRSRVSSGGR